MPPFRLLAVAFLLLATPAWSQVVPTYVTHWGVPGTGAGQFSGPTGLAIASSGQVYVVDMQNNRIQYFSASGAYIGQWGGPGAAAGQFSSPLRVATSPSGSIYVADAFNHRIQKFSSTGAYQGQWGSLGATIGKFSYPYGVAVDAQGRVFVTDLGNHRVQRFSSTGAFQLQWGSLGTGPGQMQNPSAITIAPNGNVIVADFETGHMQELGPDGTFVREWDATQWMAMPNISGLAFGPDSCLYISDSATGLVHVLGAEGQFLFSFGGSSGIDPSGLPPGEFYVTSAVAVGPNKRLYVSDVVADRITVLERPGKLGVEADPSSAGIAAVPNPVRRQSTIRFTMPAAGAAAIRIVDLAGRRVRSWEWTTLAASAHEVTWDAADAPPGVYFAQLRMSRGSRVHRIVKLR